MVVEIISNIEAPHVSGCEKYKCYRKDMKACITAAQNYISQLTNKRITVVNVYIRNMFGKTLYKWEYRPTFR